MYGLQEQYGDEIEFVWLNVDDPLSRPLREQFGIVQRSNYVLVDVDGVAQLRWFGYLDDTEMEEALQDFLDMQS